MREASTSYRARVLRKDMAGGREARSGGLAVIEHPGLDELIADARRLRDEYAPLVTVVTVDLRLGPGDRLTLEVSTSGTRLYRMGGESIPLSEPDR